MKRAVFYFSNKGSKTSQQGVNKIGFNKANFNYSLLSPFFELESTWVTVMSIPIPTGVFDLVPSPPADQAWRSTHIWQFVEAQARAVALRYACEEIRTPIFERAELFSRSVGDVTDIVSKEMYTFHDRGGRVLALRPEGTAGVLRSLLTEGELTSSSIKRLFYIGPMFRYERPQAGRFRQHHQFGVEIIGVGAPEQDAELIDMVLAFYKSLGLKDLNVYINSLGDREARTKFVGALREFLEPQLAHLSDESKVRFEKNPLRILDSKSPEDQRLLENAPSILDFLSEGDKVHFERVQLVLKTLGITYQIHPKLVRGLDYYQRTVFEITSGQLGAQNTIGAGGRYDGLIRQLGGPDCSSIGFGTGLERVIQTLIKQKQDVLQKPLLQLIIIPMSQQEATYSLQIAQSVRGAGISCYVDLSFKKLKNAFAKAASMHAQFVVVIGEHEIATERLEVKKLLTGEKRTVSVETLTIFLQHAINVQNESI